MSSYVKQQCWTYYKLEWIQISSYLFTSWLFGGGIATGADSVYVIIKLKLIFPLPFLLIRCIISIMFEFPFFLFLCFVRFFFNFIFIHWSLQTKETYQHFKPLLLQLIFQQQFSFLSNKTNGTAGESALYLGYHQHLLHIVSLWSRKSNKIRFEERDCIQVDTFNHSAFDFSLLQNT